MPALISGLLPGNSVNYPADDAYRPSHLCAFGHGSYCSANNDHKYIHWDDNASDGCKFVRGKQYIRSFDRINFEKYSPSVFGIDLYAFPFTYCPGILMFLPNMLQ